MALVPCIFVGRLWRIRVAKRKKYQDSNISEELQLKFLENYRDESYPLEVVSSILLNRSTALLFQCA